MTMLPSKPNNQCFSSLRTEAVKKALLSYRFLSYSIVGDDDLIFSCYKYIYLAVKIRKSLKNEEKSKEA